ncbi:MAG: hypothetical protein V1800_07725 [Candidatus Latescibacterota bacterium]
MYDSRKRLICGIVLSLSIMAFARFPQDVSAELIKGTFLFVGTFPSGYDFSEARANHKVPYDSLEVYDLIFFPIADYFDDPSPPEGLAGFYSPEGIIDLGSVEMSSIKAAPEGGYKVEAGTIAGHTYCLITKEKYYVKFHVYYDKLDYVLQLDGSRNLDDSTGVGRSTWAWIKSVSRRKVSY